VLCWPILLNLGNNQYHQVELLCYSRCIHLSHYASIIEDRDIIPLTMTNVVDNAERPGDVETKKSH
jgi:hypothetical protein